MNANKSFKMTLPEFNFALETTVRGVETLKCVGRNNHVNSAQYTVTLCDATGAHVKLTPEVAGTHRFFVYIKISGDESGVASIPDVATVRDIIGKKFMGLVDVAVNKAKIGAPHESIPDAASALSIAPATG